MFGHDGDLVAIHTQDFALKVNQLTLTHLHVITRLEVVFTFFTCHSNTYSISKALKSTLSRQTNIKKQFVVPVVSVTTSRSIPSGWSSNFSSSESVGLTPSVI